MGQIDLGSLMRLPSLSAAPTTPTPVDGQVYFDNVKKSIGVYDATDGVWYYMRVTHLP